MKSFTRNQLREALEMWMREPEPKESGGDALFYRGAAAYLEFLDTYEFKNGSGGKMERTTGTIKWFNKTKGFGFIIPDDAGEGEAKDIFVHQTDLPPGMVLKEGDKVEFDVQVTSKGFQAMDVVIIT